MTKKKATPLEHFAKNLKKARLELGLTQEELGAKAGVRKSFICLIESGDRAPSMGTATSLAQALKMPLDKLFAA